MNTRDLYTTCPVCREKVAIYYPAGTHPARGFPHVARHFLPGMGQCTGGGQLMNPPTVAPVAPATGGTPPPPKSAEAARDALRLIVRDLTEKAGALLNPRRQPASALPMTHWTPEACIGAMTTTARLMRSKPVPGAEAITRESARMHEAAIGYLRRFAAIEELRAEPGDSVRIYADDPDHDSERATVEVFGEWTDGELLRYDADTLDEALELAVKGRRDWEAR